MSILLVDDDEKKLLTLEAVLAELELDVIAVRCGRDALRTLLTRDVALILLDVNMPGMDGFETASLIRQRPNCENIPIIFITAYGDELFRERGYSLGAVDFILTPIIPDILRSKVTFFVKLYRQTREIHRQAAALQRRAAQLSALANELTEAEHRERRRIAQVLHDHLQQLLVAAKMRLSIARCHNGDAVDTALEAVDELIDESIKASRSLTAELAPVTLHNAGLAGTLQWLADKFLKDHRLRIHLSVPENESSLSEHVLSLLYQATRELLFNIVKHAGVSEAWIRVEQPDGTVRVVVEDRGIGFRSGCVPQQRPGGDHYGLFSIRERLRFLGGDLKIRTAEGQGTRITMTVATRFDASDVRANRTSDTMPNGEPARPGAGDGVIRVLLADDHQILRKGLAGLLAAYGDIQVVAEAPDGEEAIRLATQLRPDVVVMDVDMPGVNGIEATRHITGSLPEVQVIGLSMHADNDSAAAICKAGAVSYLNKGGAPEQLVAAIRATRAAVIPADAHGPCSGTR